MACDFLPVVMFFFWTKRPRKKIVAIQQTVFIGNKKCFATYFLSPIKSNPIILLLTIKCFTTSLFLIFCCRCFYIERRCFVAIEFFIANLHLLLFLTAGKKTLTLSSRETNIQETQMRTSRSSF